MSELSVEQKATNFETMKHIDCVRRFMKVLTDQLTWRAFDHDKSKLDTPEVDLFTEFTPKLAQTTYGSPEYAEALKGLKPALDHHYANNRHHSEHFKNGIDDMNIIDLIEMFVDWKAATLRQKDGNLRKSIEINAERYRIGPQLVKILENSMDLFDK